MSEITEEPDSTRPPVDVVARNVLSPRSNCRNIDHILRVAREFKEDYPDIASILYKHAYTLARDNLSPSTEARIMLQCMDKMPVIQDIVAKSAEGAELDPSQDRTCLLEFYAGYRQKQNVKNLKALRTKDNIRILENLKVLATVLLEQQYKTVSPEEAKRLISEESKQNIESDAAMTVEASTYNIIPIDDPATTNAITSFPEVRAAISSLKYRTDLPKLPGARAGADVLDFLQYVFGFQESSVSNQRENIVILLSDEQSRLPPLDKENPMLNEAAVKKVFKKTFDNYTNWCTYLKEEPIWKEKEDRIWKKPDKEEVTKNDQILYISLYYLIWGEAANVRFLPEGLCYIFHHMGKELDDIMGQKDAMGKELDGNGDAMGNERVAKRAKSCSLEYDRTSLEDHRTASYLERVIRPLYDVIASEADINKDGNAPYSTWRNYDDFNEYFWSRGCFELGWPFNNKSSFFAKPSATSTVHGKTLFIERQTFLHLYNSFHRLWILLVMMFQALVIIAWNDEKLNFKTLRGVLSLGPTYFIMKFVQCILDFVMMYTTGKIERIKWFTWATLSICFLYEIGRRVNTKPYLQLIIFVIYIIVLVIYVAIELYQSKLAFMLKWCDKSFLGPFLGQIPQEDCYVGRDLDEERTDYIKYMLFWFLILVINFAFAYFFLIVPLVTTTRDNNVLENWHTVWAIGSIWVGVFCVYLLAVHIIYTVISAVVSFMLGVRDGLGVIKSLDDVRIRFKSLPKAFMYNLQIRSDRRDSLKENAQVEDAARFSHFWNEIVYNLWEEDYITKEEQDVLKMPQSYKSLSLVRWPLFLLKNKIYDAIHSLEECDSQDELWNTISRNVYMKHAVKECFDLLKLILYAVLDVEGKSWVERVYEIIAKSIETKSIHFDFHLTNLEKVIIKVAALTQILAQKEVETPELKSDAVSAAQDLYKVIMGDFLGHDMSKKISINEGRLITDLNWPTEPELRSQISRILWLLTWKSEKFVVRNLEARRRLAYFTNSFFMKMPKPVAVPEILAFSVFTPYYKETVLYSMDELQEDIGQGYKLLFYLQNTYPDEWNNFLARMGIHESTSLSDLLIKANDDDKLNLELRFWASYRGQTLARTVRGMMYNRQALILQSFIERQQDLILQSFKKRLTTVGGSEDLAFQCEARAYADLKFSYVITCQLYSQQKK